MFATINKDLKETTEIIKKLKEQKKQHNIRYEKVLEELADTKIIYDYFSETKNKLADNLHNIMLGKALGNDFYANLYIKKLDPKNNCHNCVSKSNVRRKKWISK